MQSVRLISFWPAMRFASDGSEGASMMGDGWLAVGTMSAFKSGDCSSPFSELISSLVLTSSGHKAVGEEFSSIFGLSVHMQQ